MRCPYCGKDSASAVKCWETDASVRRVRACSACGRQFNTRERVEAADAVVIKRDGRRESYSREKLARSVALACAKRPLPAHALDGLVERVEAQLAGEPEVTSRRIGEVVLAELRVLDEVAYLRFASYFEPFPSAEAFVEAFEALQAWRQRSAQARLQLALDFEADQPHWN